MQHVGAVCTLCQPTPHQHHLLPTHPVKLSQVNHLDAAAAASRQPLQPLLNCTCPKVVMKPHCLLLVCKESTQSANNSTTVK
jgi:hypothetical protein